jgi:hypothetical protein
MAVAPFNHKSKSTQPEWAPTTAQLRRDWLSTFSLLLLVPLTLSGVAACTALTPESPLPAAVRRATARAVFDWLRAHPYPAYVQTISDSWHVYHSAPELALSALEVASIINSYELHGDRNVIKETAEFLAPLYGEIYSEFWRPARAAVLSQGLLAPETDFEIAQAADLLVADSFSIGLLDASEAFAKAQVSAEQSR